MREKAKDMEDRVIISLYIIGVSEGKKWDEEQTIVKQNLEN